MADDELVKWAPGALAFLAHEQAQTTAGKKAIADLGKSLGSEAAVQGWLASKISVVAAKATAELTKTQAGAGPAGELVFVETDRGRVPKGATEIPFAELLDGDGMLTDRVDLELTKMYNTVMVGSISWAN
ncbi:hypothetical protein [Kitasatospora mediocidica]|uniref:hypothetical protein n=1 Tax=Kitasatospora mediocidica TaxID=58352 RepID=UPI0005677609|nr:hypothetical protein [Kitasatospora mediocidica]